MLGHFEKSSQQELLLWGLFPSNFIFISINLFTNTKMHPFIRHIMTGIRRSQYQNQHKMRRQNSQTRQKKENQTRNQNPAKHVRRNKHYPTPRRRPRPTIQNTISHL